MRVESERLTSSYLQHTYVGIQRTHGQASGDMRRVALGVVGYDVV